MCGLCALSKKFFFLLFVILFPALLWAQAQKGTVIEDEAQVYQDPDFDAPVIAVLKAGSVYNISTTKKGPFYKIRIKPGKVGWVSEVDVRPGAVKVTAQAQEELRREKRAKEAEELRRPFFATRYWGPVVEYLNYTEDTMGEERSAGTVFYGIKWNGFNTLMSGEIYIDANLLFHSGAPTFYQDATGQSAGGFIVNGNFLFQTVDNLSRSSLFFYGFGPTLKYSHYDLHLLNAGKVIGYSADDMALGAVFDLGLAGRVGQFSLRADAKYYWEKTKYYGLGFNIGYEF